ECYNFPSRVVPFKLQTRLRTFQTIVAAAACAVVSTAIAQQTDPNRAATLARQATDRLRALQREADQLASEERTLLNDLRRLEIDRQIKAESVGRLGAQSRHLTSELAATSARIADLEHQDLAERPDVRARFVEMYKLGQARYIRLLLSTSDLRQIGRASRLVATLAQQDRDRVAMHQRTIESLKSSRAELESRGRQLESLRAE